MILTVSILFFVWFYRTISCPGGGNRFKHPNRSCACARVCARPVDPGGRVCCVNRSGRHLPARGASTWVELAAAQPIAGLPMGGRALAGRSPGRRPGVCRALGSQETKEAEAPRRLPACSPPSARSSRRHLNKQQRGCETAEADPRPAESGQPTRLLLRPSTSDRELCAGGGSDVT